jgi:hypothetical protein
MSESRNCPVCENDIPEDARFLCPHCHFELKWLDDEEAIERAKQSFAEKLYEPEENPPQELNTTSFLYHLLVGFLGGSLPWIAPGVYEYFEYGERSLQWIFWSYRGFGIPIGLVTGLVVGFFMYRVEKKNRKPHQRPFVFLFWSFIISVFLSSPILYVYWMLDAF